MYIKNNSVSADLFPERREIFRAEGSGLQKVHPVFSDIVYGRGWSISGNSGNGRFPSLGIVGIIFYICGKYIEV